MATYISILRGINVSGQKLIKMDALRETFRTMGFQNIVTYLQSGNVIFTGTGFEVDELGQKISRQIEKDFGFEVPVIVLKISMLKQIVDNNPFLKEPGNELNFLHVTFLSSQPAPYDLNPIERQKGNGKEISISGNAVYLYCPNGYGRTKLTNNFLEAKLKVTATTRNWKTATELLKIADDLDLLIHFTHGEP